MSVRQTNPVDYSERTAQIHQHGVVIWFTGLSGSGKTTIAVAVERALFSEGKLVYRLDGDDLRQGLNAGLGFSLEDRMENIRRAAHAARLLQQAGVITLASFISPLREMRSLARQIIPPGHFIEVFVRASLEVCISRDPKGNYQKALSGKLQQYTGLSPDQAYETPTNPDLILDTEQLTLDECVAKTIAIIPHYNGSSR